MSLRPLDAFRPCALLLALAAPGHAQSVVWESRAAFYGDNTEFFTPFREGETILGAQVWSALVVGLGERVEVHAGVFGDHRSGGDDFLDPVRPILSFRYRTAHSLGVLGTLQTERRHGLLEPLQVTTLELTRPVEYGLQWIERRGAFDGEIFLNWQALNTPSQREVFDYGLLARVRPFGFLTLEYQGHGLHNGGQLFDAGVPVTNNFAGGFGLRLAGPLPAAGRGSLALFALRSRGNIDPAPPAGRPGRGRGTYLRGGVEPATGWEIFGIGWWGRDFLSNEGDNHYNSQGLDPAFYRSRRRYTEIGARRHWKLDAGVTVEAELRFHRNDDEPSKAISGSDWEYSYRLVARAPFTLTLKKPAAP